MKKQGDLIGVHTMHKDRLRPEFLPKGENFGVVIEVHLDDEYGAVATIYPWGRSQEILWNKRDRAFAKLSEKEQNKIIEKQKKAWRDTSPVDTSNWIYPRKSDIKEMIACQLFYAYLTSDREERINYIGRLQALQCILYTHMPPNTKHIGWQNCSGIGSLGYDKINSLEGIIDILEGSAITTSKYVVSKFKKGEAKYNIKKKKDGFIEVKIDNHEDYLAYAKKLEDKMVIVKTTVIDD